MKQFLPKLLVGMIPLTVVSFPIQEGRCPYSPGTPNHKQMQTKFVPKDFRNKKTLGVWVNYYDEFDDINSNFECVQQMLVKEDTDLFQQKFANKISNEMRDYLKQQNDPEAELEWFVNDGNWLYFGNDTSPIATIHDLEADSETIKNTKRKSDDDFWRYYQVLYTDEQYQWMLTYSCFETAEYQDSETKRPISMQELQMKSSLTPEEYQLAIAEQVADWEREHPMAEQKKEQANKTKSEEPTKDEEKLEEKPFEAKNTSSFQEMFKSPEKEELSEDELQQLEGIEQALLEDLEFAELSDETLEQEYLMLQKAQNILKLNMDLEAWREFRRKEHREYQDQKDQKVDEKIDMDKLNYVFKGIDTVYIHKQKIQFSIRPESLSTIPDDMDYQLDKIITSSLPADFPNLGEHYGVKYDKSNRKCVYNAQVFDPQEPPPIKHKEYDSSGVKSDL